MAYQTFTAALNIAIFPFVSDFFSRSILIPGIDSPPRTPQADTGSKEALNREIAQHYYCQDVMPTVEGLQSVSYTQLIPPYTAAANDFDQVITIRDEDENTFLFAPANGKNYIYRQDVARWVSKSPFVGWAGTLVTKSYVNGRTFICYEDYAIYEYDEAADTFLPVAFTGVPATLIDGISASNNYLLWWDGITVGWSSLIDPTDLVENIQTGADSAIPQDVKGPIRCIVPVSGGFIIFTTKNAVAAFYTNNARAPFVFREIQNAGGVQNSEQVAQDGSGGVVYAYTTNGLQEIALNSSKILSPAASDFLSGRIYESFSTSTLTLTVERLNSDLKIKVNFISGRYIVISYGKVTTPQVYTHALVYDTGLERWGKLRLDHVDCFSYPYPNIIGEISNIPAKQQVAFLQKDGTVQLLVMDYRAAYGNAVLILGRYQLARQKAVTFHKMDLEGLKTNYPPSVYLILSFDGRTNQAPKALQEIRSAGNLRTYGSPAADPTSGVAGMRTALSFSILIMGTFELNSAIPTISAQGNR